MPPEIANAPKLSTATDAAGDLATMGINFEDYHTKFVDFHYGYVSQYISLADTKAAWTFTLTSGALAFLFSKDQLRVLILAPEWSAGAVLLYSALAFLTLSSLCSFLVIAPRLTTSGEGLVFFRAVAARSSANSYLQSLASTGKAELVSARIEHCYDLSTICTRKYDYLIKAMYLGLPGLWSAILSMLSKV